ncbi:MAG: thiamine pyrophosphate-dependent enzyme [Phycisphaerae bacterium]
MQDQRMLLSGNEAVAWAALDAKVLLGTGYPGTPSTEILENFSEIGGRAQWAPNEKVALEVGIGSSFAAARTLVTMKHVGVNVAADPLFTAAYTDLTGGLVLVSADDPGMASSQNEQDNRNFARAAGVPMLEPSDSQEAYEYAILGLEISEAMNCPVILRLTTRICHSRTVVVRREVPAPRNAPHYERDLPARVMIPGYARPAHRRMRAKLDRLQQWNEGQLVFENPNTGTTLSSDDAIAVREGNADLGIITSGVAFQHACEAAPYASVLKLGMSWPLPIERIRDFTDVMDRVVVIEEGDPFLYTELRAAGVNVEGKPEMYRFGELNVQRVRRILEGDTTPEPPAAKGKPPQLCKGCPHRTVFETLRDLGCIVTGDIGCYTLGVLPPFEAMDTCVCMGASVGVGLGMRHVLPEEKARKVVSVIGDSTFVHSGITGLVEMAYNRPATGHLVMILDNGTTAMTGMQEHPGTGRALDHSQAGQLDFEQLCRAIGVQNVHTVDMARQADSLPDLVKGALESDELTVIITRRPCLLAAAKIREYEAVNKANA